MSERLEIYNSRVENYEAYKKNMLNESVSLENERLDQIKTITDLKERKTLIKEEYAKFDQRVSEMLLSEALYDIYSVCLKENEDHTIARNLVCNYIGERGGVYSIFNSMSKTFALETVQALVREYHDIIMEKVDEEEPATFTASIDDKIKFLDDLNKEEDIENVKQAIALRVSNAEEEFINNNLSDRFELDTIMNDTKSRLEANKADRSTDSETKEAIEQEMVNMSKQAIETVREDRTRNVFEQMVRNISEATLINEPLRESYCESGKLNVSKIVESTRSLYGFLETINTLQLEKVDEDYIKKTLNEMV